MIRRPWFLLAAAFWSCSDDRSAGGGGFETGDLHARVTTPAGKPAARAQVWLVRSNGDSAPATVLDSGLTNDSGCVGFVLPVDAGREGLGLDARLEDSLGIAQRMFRKGDSAEIHLSSSGEVEAWVDSTRRIPSLFVPGSHFLSRKSDSVPKSGLRLPRGEWDVVLKSEERTRIVRAVSVAALVVNVGPSAWSTKNLVWTDSLELPKAYIERVLYRDRTLAAVGGWLALDSAFAGLAMDPQQATGSGGAMILRAGALPGSDKSWGGGVGAPLLPVSGALVVDWHLDLPPASTPHLVRLLTVEDSQATGGVQVVLDPDRKPYEWVSYLGGSASAGSSVDSISEVHLSSDRWVVAWDQKYLYVWSGGALLACTYRSMQKTPPHVRIGLWNKDPSKSEKMVVDSVRLYQVH